MRLGIRRKLIGTLVLVGVLPLGLSLLTIMALGARWATQTLQLSCELAAHACASQLSIQIAGKLDRLALFAKLPGVEAYLRQVNGVAVGPGVLVQPQSHQRLIRAQWERLSPQSSLLRPILNNELTDRMALLTVDSKQRYHLLVTDRFGNVVAADAKPREFDHSQEPWWRAAFADGRGRVVVRAVERGGRVGLGYALLIAVPIRDPVSHSVLGVVVEWFDAAWVESRLAAAGAPKEAVTQVYDPAARKAVFGSAPATQLASAEQLFASNSIEGRNHWISALLSGSLAGVRLLHFYMPLESAVDAPHWYMIVSEPAAEAIEPLSRLARTVGVFGLLLILMLFLLGYVISQREIVGPLQILRETINAVGRGELNVRAVSTQEGVRTFRQDEFGDLAAALDSMTQRLQHNIHQLERTNQAKKRFLELASHELKTPITSLLLTCDLMKRKLQSRPVGGFGPGDLARLREGVMAIETRGYRMKKIIEDLLKLAETNRFTTPLVRQPLDIRELLLEVAGDQAAFLAERGQKFTYDIPENLPRLAGDRDKLADVFTNVISNAIRFSPDGSEIKISAHKTFQDNIEIDIEDSGPGISSESLGEIFEPFAGIDDTLHHHSGTTEYGSKGPGLGLAIVRRFVELHGGSVKMESAPHGTKVRIVLPLRIDAQSPASVKS